MHELQAQLARLSTQGRQIIVKDSHHAISEEAPDAVINAVRDVVKLVREDRSKSSPPDGEETILSEAESVFSGLL